jgi:hypothetical protein
MCNKELLPNLDSISKTVNDWLKFAEQKLSGLIILNGGIIWGYTKITSSQTVVISISENLNIVGYSFLLISILLSIVAIMPILTGFWYFKAEKTSLDNLQYFGDIHKYNAREYVGKLATSLGISNHRILDFETDLAGQLIINSKITNIKFSRYKAASVLTFIAIIIFSVAQFFNLWLS